MSANKREQVADWLEVQELDAPTWDEFDDAILGLSVHAPGRPPLVVCSLDRMIAILMERGLELEEAREYLDHNIAGAWIGDGTPVIVREVEP